MAFYHQKVTIKVYINEELASLDMKLSNTGEAYFEYQGDEPHDIIYDN